MNGWLGKRSKPVRAIVIVLALLFIALEWLTRVLADSIHFLVRRFGWIGFENWLRALPLWCVVPVTLVVFIPYAGLEIGQFMFIAAHHYWLAALMHLLKWGIFPVLSYIWRLYDERLLEYSWVRWTYNLVMFVHNLVVDWIHHQDFYKKAIEIKNMVKETTKTTVRNLIAGFRRWRKRRATTAIKVAIRFLRRR